MYRVSVYRASCFMPRNVLVQRLRCSQVTQRLMQAGGSRPGNCRNTVADSQPPNLQASPANPHRRVQTTDDGTGDCRAYLPPARRITPHWVVVLALRSSRRSGRYRAGMEWLESVIFVACLRRKVLFDCCGGQRSRLVSAWGSGSFTVRSTKPRRWRRDVGSRVAVPEAT